MSTVTEESDGFFVFVVDVLWECGIVIKQWTTKVVHWRKFKESLLTTVKVVIDLEKIKEGLKLHLLSHRQ